MVIMIMSRLEAIEAASDPRHEYDCHYKQYLALLNSLTKNV